MGWDPRRAVLVRPPTGLSAESLAAVLQALPCLAPMTAAPAGGCAGRGRRIRRGVRRAGGRRGAAVSERRSSAPGAVDPGARLRAADRAADRGAAMLGRAGRRPRRTPTPRAATGVDLVVLADWLAADPRLLRDLHTAAVPHLPVRVRDGAGLVGPLVIPGVTSCLVVRRPAPHRTRPGLAGAERAAAGGDRLRRPSDRAGHRRPGAGAAAADHRRGARRRRAGAGVRHHLGGGRGRAVHLGAALAPPSPVWLLAGSWMMEAWRTTSNAGVPGAT